MRRFLSSILGLIAALGFAYYLDTPQQPQPLQGSPATSVVFPNPVRTPGAINTAVTQATIGQTICNTNWSTKSIRPPTSYTSPLKLEMLQSGYNVGGDTNPSDYELDHLISLELGGNPTDPKNLWPESYKTTPNARDKDKVENYLHTQVCAKNITLAEAQKEISSNWIAVYNKMGKMFGGTGAVLSDDPSDQ